MSEDVCGAECVDGSECQHPAGSCPVPSHSDPDAENPHGRDFALGEEDHDALLEAAREGLSKAGCARTAGVSRTSLDRYLDAHDEFRAAFTRARSVGERRLVDEGLHDPDADPSMAKFLLSTSFGYIKTERREVEGDLDLGDVTVDFSE